MDSTFELIRSFIDIVLHLDLHLNNWITALGPGIYLLLIFVIFAETGLVVFPFLPGDSFLFALGALTAVDQAYLSLPVLLITLTLAAILGDAVNNTIGKYAGPRIFRQDTGMFLNKSHLARAQHFYEKHGGKTIIIARFAPIIRTFAPFVAGVGHMHYGRFASYNVIGGVLWVCSFLFAGHFFGNLPQVKSHFHVVIIAIIAISLVPVALEWWKRLRASRQAKTTLGDHRET